MPSVKVNDVDGAELWPAPNAFQFIRCVGLDLTTSTADAIISLKSGSTEIWSTAKGGAALNIDPSRTLDCANGEALVLGVTGGATVRGSIEVVVKGRPNTALAPLG